MSTWTSWSEVRDAWSSGWLALSERAVAAYGAAIRANPSAYVERVAAFVSVLAESRATLDRMRPKLPSAPRSAEERRLVERWALLDRRYHDLAAGFYADARPAPSPSVQGPPVAAVVIVVGAVAVGLVGTAWAVVGYEYAVNLQEQTALAERELDARITASREGRPLQPSTLPPPPAAGIGLGVVLVGGLAVVAGALVLPTLLRR